MFDLDQQWQVHPRVALRPERFGALLYHFNTRKLSFLKNPTLLKIVQSLADQPTARAALIAADVPAAQFDTYCTALNTLATSDMIVQTGK